MQTIPKTYLQIVSFSNLLNWSVQYMLETSIRYAEKYQLVELNEFLKRNKKAVDIEDANDYRRVTIKTNNGGVYLRDIEKGKNIGTKKQFLVSEGQFLLSKIDARNGAFGVVPKELEGAIVTNDFPSFVIQRDILPQFLLLITTTKEFIHFAQSCSSGTTNRQRMDISKFLSQKIPIPSLSEQKQLVESYNAKIREAEALEKQALILEEGIEKYLFEKLGIEKRRPLTPQKRDILNFCNFSDLYRWDIPYLKNEVNSKIKSQFGMMKFSAIIAHFNKDENNKSLRIETKYFPDDNFRYIGMENIEKNSGLLCYEENSENIPEIRGAKIKSQTIRVPKDYIIYGKLRPYLNKYWTNETDAENIVCSSEFFVFKIKKNIDKKFFINVLSSSVIQRQISDLSSGARMPRINEDIFMNIEIPLPPISIQNEIANQIQEMRNSIIFFRQKAEAMRKEAIIEFEKEIFE